MKLSRPGAGYQPIQLYHLSDRDVRCETGPPNPALSGSVYFHWLLHVDVDFVELEVIPDNALDIVVSPSIPGFAALYFPVDAPFRIPLYGPVTYAGASLRTVQGASLLGHELDALKRLTPGLETVDALGLESLVASIQGATELPAIQSALDTFLANRSSFDAAQPLRGVMDHLQTHLEASGVAKVAGTMGISERQFRRLSSSLLGLSPKKIQRVLRLQRVLQELFSPDAPDRREGFYDDSHLIRESKRLTGLTPGQLRTLAEKYNSEAP